MIHKNKTYKLVNSTKGINCKKCAFSRETNLSKVCGDKAGLKCNKGKNWFVFDSVIIQEDLIDNQGQISLF